MKLVFLTLSAVLVGALLSMPPVQAGNFNNQMIHGKGRQAAALRQLNLSPSQISQINMIKKQPRGTRKHDEIQSVLTQSQRDQYHMLMHGQNRNHGYGRHHHSQQPYGSYGPQQQQGGSYGAPQQNGYAPQQQQQPGSYGAPGSH